MIVAKEECVSKEDNKTHHMSVAKEEDKAKIVFVMKEENNKTRSIFVVKENDKARCLIMSREKEGKARSVDVATNDNKAWFMIMTKEEKDNAGSGAIAKEKTKAWHVIGGQGPVCDSGKLERLCILVDNELEFCWRCRYQRESWEQCFNTANKTKTHGTHV